MGRTTNLALLALTGMALVTGVVAFTMGSAPVWFVVTTHAVVGFGVVVLTRWKTVIARRGMKRRRAGTGLSFALAVATLVTIITGILQVSGLSDRIGPVSVMQVHVATGVATTVLLLIHFTQRPVRPRKADLNRRNLIRVGGLIGAAGLAYMATETAWRLTSAPGAERRVTGSHQISEPTSVPATQWLNDTVPTLSADDHEVRVDGISFDIDQLAGFDDAMTATLDCTGGWYTTQTWSGVRLHRLIKADSGSSIVVRSATGYWRRFPIQDADRLLLATSMAHEPLAAGHGAPVRLVAEGRRGFWWVKWVSRVDIDNLPPWWQPPLPLA